MRRLALGAGVSALLVVTSLGLTAAGASTLEVRGGIAEQHYGTSTGAAGDTEDVDDLTLGAAGAAGAPVDDQSSTEPDDEPDDEVDLVTP